MKTNGARILIIAIILYICLVIFSFTSFAASDYNFSKREDNASFKVYPSAVGSSATLNIKAEKSGVASFRLVDHAGRNAHEETLNVQKGTNTLLSNKVGQVKPGNYIALLEIDHSTYNQKILKK